LETEEMVMLPNAEEIKAGPDTVTSTKEETIDCFAFEQERLQM